MVLQSICRIEDLLNEYFGKDLEVLAYVRDAMSKLFGGSWIYDIPTSELPREFVQFIQKPAEKLGCKWCSSVGWFRNNISISTGTVLDIEAVGKVYF